MENGEERKKKYEKKLNKIRKGNDVKKAKHEEQIKKKRKLKLTEEEAEKFGTIRNVNGKIKIKAR